MPHPEHVSQLVVPVKMVETMGKITRVTAMDGHFEYISDFMELGKKIRQCFFRYLPLLHACVIASISKL